MMDEFLIYGDTLPQAYHGALRCLRDFGEITACDDWNTRQKEITATIFVENPLQEPMISRCMIGGARELEQYRQEMLDGILDFEVEKGKWAYTYHDRMVRYPAGGKYVDQVQFVIDELKRNPSSRRAVIIIRDVGVDAGSTDPACLQHLQYFIRDGKLHCKVLFRSNDACKATFMNAFALIMLQKRIADALNVPIGTYTHRANSFHAYEHDWMMLESYYSRIKSGNDLTYDYVGDWKDEMEEYRPEIVEMVEELKTH